MIASATHDTASEADLIGGFRTFGPFGPVYRIDHSVGTSHVHIVVLESGEELDYPLEHALNDPEAE